MMIMKQNLDQYQASGHKPKLLFGVGTPFPEHNFFIVHFVVDK